MNFQSVSVRLVTTLAVVAGLAVPGLAQNADDAQLQQALGIKPKQRNVDFDQPTGDELKDCNLSTTKNPDGFQVTDNANRVLRRFLDNNGDKHLDQWSYYKNGVEVYRDVDANNDTKTDSYRWLGSEGTRWGLDPNQDGVIDSWKVISAEEVAMEAFEAIKNQDAKRFARVLLTSDQLNSLGLGTPVKAEVEKRLKVAQSDFLNLCKSQNEINDSSEWIQPGSSRPSMIAAGANGNKTDLVVYEHASAVFKSKDFGQLALGTIVQIGPMSWRLIELPEVVSEGKAIGNGGALFPLPTMSDPVSASSPNSAIIEHYEDLQKIDKDLDATKKPVEIAALEKKRAQVIEQLFLESKDEKAKQDWVETLADSVSSAYRSDRFPDGRKYLIDFMGRLKKAGHKDGVDHIYWRIINTDYYLADATEDSKGRSEAHDKWLEDLIAFQKQFTDSRFAPEALCHLGINFEVAEEPKEAESYYADLVKRYPKTVYGQRAAGALVRLQSKGKAVEFVGETLKGQKFSLQDSRLRGKIVVLHFWETWCTDGLDDIKRLVEKHKDDVVFVGCNIENDTDTFKKYLDDNRDISWVQLHAPGSMEQSPLAHQLGVPSEPLVLLFDKEGKLVESDIAFSDLDREIERTRRRKK